MFLVVSAFFTATGCTLQAKTAKPLSDYFVLRTLAEANTNFGAGV